LCLFLPPRLSTPMLDLSLQVVRHDNFVLALSIFAASDSLMCAKQRLSLVQTFREAAPRGDTDSDWADHENNLIRPNGRLITAVDCKRRALGYHCVMAFDSFGRHSWTFQELVVDSRTANVRFRDNSWEYFDSVTGTVMNPLDPFPNSEDRDGPKSRRANR
jgi:hypothetical protein